MEKAHPGVQDMFFQVFDKGNMKDGEGRDIDFKNTVIIMTSNAGTDLIAKLFADPETTPDAAGLAEALQPELMKIFKPAFLGRVTLVPYFPLSAEIIRRSRSCNCNRMRAPGAASYWREVSATIQRWSTRSRRAAPKDRQARATSRRSCRARCCRNCQLRFCRVSPKAMQSIRSPWEWTRVGRSNIQSTDKVSTDHRNEGEVPWLSS